MSGAWIRPTDRPRPIRESYVGSDELQYDFVTAVKSLSTDLSTKIPITTPLSRQSNS